MDLNLESMAEAHLNTVQKAVEDLENQIQSMYNEIRKLQEYLEKGREVINASKCV